MNDIIELKNLENFEKDTQTPIKEVGVGEKHEGEESG